MNYILMYNANDEEMSWGFIPDELWKRIVVNFIDKQVTGIAFDNIASLGDIANHPFLDELHLSVNYHCTLKTSFRNKLGKLLQSEESLLVFDYHDEMKTLINQTPFHQWTATNDDIGIDDIYFFKNDLLLMSITAHESQIVFYNSEIVLPLIQQIIPDDMQHMYPLTNQLTVLVEMDSM